MKTLNIGTILENVELTNQKLIPALSCLLNDISEQKINEVLPLEWNKVMDFSERKSIVPDDANYWMDSNAKYLLTAIIDKLNDYAPEGYYFGKNFTGDKYGVYKKEETANIEYTSPIKGKGVSLATLAKRKGDFKSDNPDQHNIYLKRGMDTYEFDPDDLEIVKGHNIRPINQNQVRYLADVLLSGERLDPIDIKLMNKTDIRTGETIQVPQVMHGEHRTLAGRLAKSEGWTGKLLAFNFTGSEDDAIIRMVSSTRSEPIKETELAEAAQRLSNNGMTNANIAKKLHINPMRVTNLLRLADAPAELKIMVDEGSLTVSRFNSLARSEANYVDVLATAAVEAEEKATRKEEKEKAKKAGKKVSSVSAGTSKYKKAVLSKQDIENMQSLIEDMLLDVPDVLAKDTTFELKITKQNHTMFKQLEKRFNDISEHNAKIEIEKRNALLAQKQKQQAAKKKKEIQNNLANAGQPINE